MLTAGLAVQVCRASWSSMQWVEALALAWALSCWSAYLWTTERSPSSASLSTLLLRQVLTFTSQSCLMMCPQIELKSVTHRCLFQLTHLLS